MKSRIEFKKMEMRVGNQNPKRALKPRNYRN
jgi:hypothetical protein